jgi:putative ABC transport system substrate-binding protein
MSKIISCLALSWFLLSDSAQAQSGRTYTIGFLAGLNAPYPAPGPNVDAFRQGLRDLGYVEGKNITIEYRWGEGKLERMPELAAELVRNKVDVIVTQGMPAVLAAKKATSTIPIVAANSDNLVEAGVVASLARPGGNVTGSTRIDADFSAKRLELLKEALPKLSRVAVLSHGTLGGDQEELQESRTAARNLGIQLQSLQTREPNDFSHAFSEMIKRHADALIIITSSFTSAHRIQLIELASKNRLPTVCGQALWSGAGCAVSYGPNLTELYRRAAYLVDKILKGSKPADLPVERPRKYELIINLKTAKQIGLTIPPNVLARADKVIK